MRLHPQTIDRLNPPRSDETPAGFTRTRFVLTRPIPCAVPLELAGLAVVLVMPSGRIRRWLSLDQTQAFASGAAQRTAREAPAAGGDAFAAARQSAAPYLMVLAGRQMVDASPLACGPTRIITRPDAATGGREAVAALRVIDFQLTVSALAAPVPVGCWIDIAARRIGPGETFRMPMARLTGPQVSLARAPEALAFETGFESAVEAQTLADGTPVGGLGWWQANGHG